MVFANLQSHEKDAFFSLLDEYFASRPDVFANVGGGLHHADAGSSSGGAAASAVHRALASNPEATSKLFSAGLKHGVPKSSPYASAASDPEVNSAAGRFAAASFAFSAKNSGAAPPPQRSPPPVAEKPPGHGGLVSSRKFGDVDTTSTKNMFGSLYSSNTKKNANSSPPLVPPAFAPKKSAFAPPPVRRAGSTVADSPPPAPAPPPPPPQRHQPPPEEEEEGEWAEALYDYDSQESGDLNIKADQRVLVTERTSDDWWTGVFNGQKGLFPASYVKIL
ncbi:LAS seventeen-binding protein 1 [Hypsizygus marmoreus]|uniref:LAS seventeen-binding protein 1 n=1 Tax=Hypsizygus marmoreus TaxID=39966 RepID=A0A369JG59_HYPMA|nr:LAS seventeen-binding protein 1 [Hypsizygus marmoreus]